MVIISVDVHNASAIINDKSELFSFHIVLLCVSL